MISWENLKVNDIIVYSFKWKNKSYEYIYSEVIKIDGDEITLKGIFSCGCDVVFDGKTKICNRVDYIPMFDVGDAYRIYAVNDDNFNAKMSVQEFISKIEELFPEYFI